jgi:hypothetical protein
LTDSVEKLAIGAGEWRQSAGNVNFVARRLSLGPRVLGRILDGRSNNRSIFVCCYDFRERV